MTITNRYVVPFSPFLLIRYDAHINVEVVCTVAVVKYLYKYILKGPDRIMVRIGSESRERDISHDEIERFQVGRYISASEACWRLYEYPLQQKYPSA